MYGPCSTRPPSRSHRTAPRPRRRDVRQTLPGRIDARGTCDATRVKIQALSVPGLLLPGVAMPRPADRFTALHLRVLHVDPCIQRQVSITLSRTRRHLSNSCSVGSTVSRRTTWSHLPPRTSIIAPVDARGRAESVVARSGRRLRTPERTRHSRDTRSLGVRGRLPHRRIAQPRVTSFPREPSPRTATR